MPVNSRFGSEKMNMDENLIRGENAPPRLYKHFVQPCLAEFIATTLFVFVGCMSVTSGQVVGIALGHGFMIILLISAIGGLSGGHINPAVTLGAAIGGGTPPILAVAYIISQILGGLLGAGLVKGVLPGAIFSNIGGGAHDIGAEVSPGQAILCEMMLTSVLVLVVLMTAVDTDTNKLAPIAIGLTVAADILAGASVSGASMNPARSFGPAVAISGDTLKFWSYHYVYWVGPFLGSILASLIYRFLLGNDEKRIVFN